MLAAAPPSKRSGGKKKGGKGDPRRGEGGGGGRRGSSSVDAAPLVDTWGPGGRRGKSRGEPQGEQRVLELERWGEENEEGKVKVQQAVEEELRRLMAKKASKSRPAVVTITATMKEDRWQKRVACIPECLSAQTLFQVAKWQKKNVGLSYFFKKNS